MGIRMAKNLMSASFTDWIALSPDYSIVETPMPVKWSGKTLQELDVRRNYEVNVVGIKRWGARRSESGSFRSIA